LLASEKRKDWVRASGLQLIAFGDGGFVWQKSGSADIGQQDARIASAGIGARFNAGSYVSGSIEAAMPFLKAVESQGNSDPRVFFRLSARF
jgi:hemolysin activation/secretion protein